MDGVAVSSLRVGSGRRRKGRDLRWAYILVGGLGTVLLASSFLNGMTVADSAVDLVTLWVVWHSLHGDPRGRYVPAMMVGLIRDLMSASPFGMYAVLYGLLHRVLSGNRMGVRRNHPLLLMALAFGAVLLIGVATHACLLTRGAGIGWSLALERSAISAALSAPLLPLINLLMQLLLPSLGTDRRPCGAWAI